LRNELWQDSANSDYLSNKFRDAANRDLSGIPASEFGTHEWVPCEEIINVLTHARDLNNDVTAVKWLRLQHILRTNTTDIVFKPALTGPDIVTFNGLPHLVLHGHSGAIYLDGRPRTNRQLGASNFHGLLSLAFSRNKQNVIAAIHAAKAVADSWLWDGEVVQGGDPEHVLPLHPGMTHNGSAIDPATFASTMRVARTRVLGDFDRWAQDPELQ
jgi:hypothetical protein